MLQSASLVSRSLPGWLGSGEGLWEGQDWVCRLAQLSAAGLLEAGRQRVAEPRGAASNTNTAFHLPCGSLSKLCCPPHAEQPPGVLLTSG